MKKLKRRLALLLTALMLITTLPVTALAAELEDGNIDPDPTAMEDVLAAEDQSPDESYEDSQAVENGESEDDDVADLLGYQYIETITMDEVDLTGYLAEELTALPWSELLPGVDLQNVTALAVDYNPNDNEGGNGEYTVVKADARTVDLSSLTRRYIFFNSISYNTYSLYNLEVINSDDQLNTNAIRYIVPVRIFRASALLDLDAYLNETKLDTDTYDGGYWSCGNGYYSLETTDKLPKWDIKKVLVSMKLNDKLSSELTDGLTAKVYEGTFRTVEEIDPAKEITARIWNTDDRGYCADWLNRPAFTVVLERNDQLAQILNISVDMDDKGVNFGFDLSTVATEDTPAEKIDVNVSVSGSTHYERTYYIRPGNYDTWKSGEVTLKLRYKAAEDYPYSSPYNEVYSDYADKTDVTVYTGYYEEEEALLAAVAANETEDITHDIWDVDGEGYTADYTDMSSRQAFTVVVKEKGSSETAYFVPFYVYMSAQAIGPVRVWMGSTLYVENPYNTSDDWNIASEEGEQNPETLTYYYPMRYTTAQEMQAGHSYPMNGKYYIGFQVQGETMDESHESALAKIARIEDQDGQDVKDAIFGDGSNYYHYYQVDFSRQPVVFTVYFTDESAEPQVIRLRTLPAIPPQKTGSTDTYFNVTGVDDYETYAMPSHADSSFHNGFQVIFVDTTAEELESKEIEITYTTGSGVRMYWRHDEQGQRIYENKISAEVKSGEPVLFSAASESGTHLRNYWITFIAKDSEAKLWVNGQNDTDHVDKVTGLPLREVFISQSSGYYDIFFANAGVEPLTGLDVKLTSANDNIQLDDYWTIGDTKTLAGFTTTKIHQNDDGLEDAYSQLENMAKIRVWASGKGIVDAILTITANGQEPVSIKLTGKVGQAAIISSAVPDGVKYVPYSCLIQTSYAGRTGNDPNQPAFQIVGGALPANVSINEKTGEIYGVPRARGVFNFTVGIFQGGQMVDSRSFTMNIADNTDENVWNASDPTYEVRDSIGVGVGDDFTGRRYVIDLGDNELTQADLTFVSNGPYIYYVKVFLDSNLLEPGVDYFSDEGSTKIVLAEGTVRKNNTNGSHTLAIEFRESDGRRTVDDEVYQGTLKRTSQNYYIEGGVNPSTSRPSTGGNTNVVVPPSDDTSSSNTTSKPSASKPSNTPAQPSQPTTPDGKTFPFVDVRSGDWFYNDIFWTWDYELMTGTTSTTFEPDTQISQAMIVVVLARLVDIDLSAFENVTVAGAEPGAWYTTAAAWAQQTGMLPDNSTFSGDGALSRDGMAIMLVKYLASMGVDTTVGGELAFDDMDQMTDAGRNAFQVLCHYGIFKGMGDNTMNPGGATTRAQFAALLHRISDFVASR